MAINQSSAAESYFRTTEERQERFFQRRNQLRFNLDLSNASLVEVLQAYQEKQRKKNKNYSILSAIVLIQNIERDEYKCKIIPEDVCAEFWIDFENYYVNTPAKNGTKRHSSSADTYSNQIIAALGWGQLYGVKLDPTFREKKFSKYSKKKITPSLDQISFMYHYDIDVKENRNKIRKLAEEMNMKRFSFAALHRVRDHFVLSCSLGQRISDSKRLEPENIQDGIYETTQQKTGNKAIVDLKKYAIDYSIVKEILERYDYKAPAYGMDSENFNKYLRLLCRSIGDSFNKIISWEYKECGTIKRESAPMWKLMTSHVARRTFITNQILRGITIPELTRASRHQDPRHIGTYYAPENS